MPQDWSPQEVALIVQDYFSMLGSELQGIPYSKKQHRTALVPKLDNRSDGSIEFKHQNISAVLANAGDPYIKGYKPRGNFQQLLEDQVLGYMDRQADKLDPLFQAFANQAVPQITPKSTFTNCQVAPPSPSPKAAKKEPIKQPSFRASKNNYLEKEERNRDLGKKGEKFIVEYEQWRLTEAGRPDLAARVDWISQTKGDGKGYDILSFNVDGTPRYIEVKTTKLLKETPIFLTANEIAFATLNPNTAYLYRVFDAADDPKFFVLQGLYERSYDLIATHFKAVLKTST